MFHAIDALLFRKVKVGVTMRQIRNEESIPWCDRQEVILELTKEYNELEIAVAILKKEWLKAVMPSLN